MSTTPKHKLETDPATWGPTKPVPGTAQFRRSLMTPEARYQEDQEPLRLLIRVLPERRPL